MTKNKSNQSLLSKISAVVCASAGIVIIIMLGYMLVFSDVNVVKNRADSGYTVVNDYSCREAESAESPIGVKKIYTITLPYEITNDTYFAFYAVHQYAEVYVDGEPVYSLKPNESNKIGKTTGSNWVVFPLYGTDCGKELRVEITPVYENFRNRKMEFLIGSQLAIYTQRLKKDLPQIVLGFAAVLAGITFLIIAIYKFVRERRGTNLAALGLFSLMTGIWRLTDTRFTPFAVPGKSVFMFYTSVSMLMIGMVLMIKSIQNRFNKISIRIFDVYCVLCGLLCLVQLALQIFNIADIRETLFMSHIMILLGILVIAFNTIYDNLRFPENENRQHGRRLPLVCIIGVAADIAVYYIRGTSSGLIFSLLAFLLYILFTGILILIDYNEQENRLKEQEVMLADSRISAMISQIQPHFIFNSLTAIKHLCKKDPEDAQDAIDNFSFFLRGSLDALSLKNCVAFEHELEITKNYLYLEQKRFGDKLKILYDIKEKAFFIPALSVQPIVENAVRHGIRQKNGAGCVKISTYTYGRNCFVKVSDDGVGFDMENLNKDGMLHVGISNVENRLKLMCGGTLEIKSTPGKGTEVTIKVPKAN